MELKELIREKVFAEIIAERAGIILNQHQQLETMQKEVEAKRTEITRLQDKVIEMEGKIVEMNDIQMPSMKIEEATIFGATLQAPKEA